MKFTETLKNKIKEKRDIRDSTLNAYIFNINKLHKLMFDKDVENLKFLNDKNKVMETLKEKKLSTIKSYLASIVVSLMSFDENEDLIKYYRDKMEDLSKQFNDEMLEQKKSQSQNNNWVSLDKLQKVMRKYRNELVEKKIFHKEPNSLTNKEFDLLQKWVVSSLYVIDDANPPLRNNYSMKVVSQKEYNELSDNDKQNDNYLINKSRNKKIFSLGNYKTSGKYGTKLIDVSKKLNSVLNIWLKFNTSEFLLLNSKKQRMSNNSLTKFLNKTFEPTGKKNISSSLIRHIFITTKFPPNLSEKEDISSKMLHSVDEQTKYSKK